MLRARGSLRPGVDIARAVWTAITSDIKWTMVSLGLRDPGDLTLGQIAWLLPQVRAPRRLGVH